MRSACFTGTYHHRLLGGQLAAEVDIVIYAIQICNVQLYLEIHQATYQHVVIPTNVWTNVDS